MRQKGLLSGKKKELFHKLKLNYRRLLQDIVKLEEQEKKLQKNLKTLREAVIQVFDQVYPGVEIWIADQRFLVVRPLHNVIFYRKGPQVVYRFAH